MQTKIVDYRKIFRPCANKGQFLLSVKVKAGSNRDFVEGMLLLNDVWYLKISIKAAPEHGRANKAIISFLAKQFNLPQKSLQIISGHKINKKNIMIEVGSELAQVSMLHALG